MNTKIETKRMKLEEVTLDDQFRVRTTPNQEAIDNYADQMGEEKFPPVTVFTLDGKTYLVDGFHRYAAAQKRGFKDIPCEIREGTRDDALVFAIQANLKHGIRFTNADKRNAVTAILKSETFKKEEWTNGKVAEICGVSDRFVGEIKKELSSNGSDMPNQVAFQKNGKQSVARSRHSKKKNATDEKAPNGSPVDSENDQHREESQADAENTVAPHGATTPSLPDQDPSAKFLKLSSALFPMFAQFSKMDPTIGDEAVLENLRKLEIGARHLLDRHDKAAKEKSDGNNGREPEKPAAA